MVESALEAGERRLQQAGFSSRSGFLTSPTFGGLSWLAHITLQSGLWVDNQRRYDHLVTLDRLTLTDAFGRAGWRTVADAPANEEDWPVATTYYHYDQVYDRRNVGICRAAVQLCLDAGSVHPGERSSASSSSGRTGPPSWPRSTWSPATPPGRRCPGSSTGAGSATARSSTPMPAEGESPEEVWRDPDLVKAAYAESVAYSLDAVTSFVQQLHDQNLVLVVLGDHQPASIVPGGAVSHDVPVSIIAADPAVTDRAADWGWQEGLRPDDGAPVWPMDAFRDRFLTAYGPLSASLSSSTRH